MEETDGLFDDTIYPVMKLWGFPTGNYHVPTAAEVQKKLALVDGNKVEIQTRDSDEKGRDSKEKAKFVTLGADQQIDFGGIAKGYTGQKLAELFQNMAFLPHWFLLEETFSDRDEARRQQLESGNT
ncbi:MAG: FAD:protein FMN transferase [Blautia marasmi]